MGNPIKTARQMFDQFLERADPSGIPAPKVQGPQAKAAAGALASKGGVARAAKLPPKKRQQIAKTAANARWKKP